MKIVTWGGAQRESWRPGSETLVHASARGGAERLCVGEQWFQPGTGTPLARHEDGVEEVISVLRGAAEIHVEDETRTVAAGQSVIIPGGSSHQLLAGGDEPLHIWFAFSSPSPLTMFADRPGDGFVIGGLEGDPPTA